MSAAGASGVPHLLLSRSAFLFVVQPLFVRQPPLHCRLAVAHGLAGYLRAWRCPACLIAAGTPWICASVARI